MALFSFRHSVKTFSEKRTDESRIARQGQTAAHLRYITRPQAARVVFQQRLAGSSTTCTATKAEVDAQKRRGRVCERFVVALPIEATQIQREALTRAFAEQFSQGVAGYIVAIHDQHKNDINNPHAHFVFFDVHKKSGGRGRPKSTLGMARKHAIEKTAKLWANLHNDMMRNWGFGADSEISHQSFADRGIDKIPSIHEGPGARAISRTVKQPCNPQWAHIDQGHTRAEANQIIREINTIREEHKIAESNRLGASNGDHKEKCDGGIVEQRKRSCGNDQAITRNRPPFLQAESLDDNREPAGRAANAADSPIESSSATNSGSQSVFPPLDRLRLVSIFRRRRSIRRIYRELILLRDTLRARLLPPLNEAPLFPSEPYRPSLRYQSETKTPPSKNRAVRATFRNDPG